MTNKPESEVSRKHLSSRARKLAGAAALLTLSFPTPAVETTEAETQIALEKSIGELLGILREEKIIQNSVTNEQRLRILKGIVESLDCDLELYSGTSAIPSTAEKGNIEGKNRVVSLEKKTLYARLVDFSDSAVKTFRKEFQEKCKEDSTGLVLDLRKSSGQNFDILPDLQTSLDEYPVTIAVLINGATEGSAEKLIGNIRGKDNVFIIGNPSHGCPFENRKLMLSSGETLLMPNMKQSEPGSAAPIQPDLQIFLSTPTSESANSPRKDPAVSTAVDLIRAVRAFTPDKQQEKEFQR